MSQSQPAFHSVQDLGFRDVGVKNEPRRLAAYFGKRSVPLIVLAFAFAFAVCAIMRRTGAEWWALLAFLVMWTATVLSVTVRAVTRSPVTVVRVTADGTNQATWLVLAHMVPVVAAAAVIREPLLIAAVAMSLVFSVFVWRARGRVPALLRQLRALLAAGERVEGDGLGLAVGARNRRDSLRLVVATDRRVLVAASSHTALARPLLLDVPYELVKRFGFEWKRRGRVGELSLTAGETHVISLAPANLVSIARALRAHGVEADDPAAITEAEDAWEAALRRGRSPSRWLDREAMSAPAFDRGLWLFLALCAVLFYVNPLGIGLGAARDAVPVLLALPVLSAICGYVSRTPSSLTYLVPLNLLVAPAFLAAEPRNVIVAMVLVSAMAAVGLCVGSALAGAVARRADEPAGAAARGSLRHAISGRRLIRFSAVLLALMGGLVATAGAAGFELGTLRLAVQEVTAEQVPVDGRSNLTGGAASLTYTPGPGLHEFILDETPQAGPADGARWELRTSIAKGDNALTLAHYIFTEPRLDDAAAVAGFVAGKDRQHSLLAGFRVTHTRRVVDGRVGYVWNHGSYNGYWYYVAWFPQPVHSVRVECIAKRQIPRFKRLCAEAFDSLEFH